MSESRQTAFDALIKTERQGGFSNLTLDSVLSKTNLDTRDRSFVSNIFYGVIERQITIDYQLSKYFSIQFFMHWRFDDSVKRDADLGYSQLKEFLTLNFNYSW